MASENLKEMTDDTFQAEALESKLPVVVDFWAPWCGPCKMLTPILEELAEEYDGNVVFAKINIDDNPHVASKYGINSIPSLLFIKNGSVEDQQVGLLAKGPLKAKIDKFIGA
ncbi:MAG: thioredoxin [Chitinivibrionales bacterium]|nr:thioredoxin [Chitinivibrionales bacterium]MBD3356223.1 thioredoxin [Chitinivibrionales bacterium]